APMFGCVAPALSAAPRIAAGATAARLLRNCRRLLRLGISYSGYQPRHPFHVLFRTLGNTFPKRENVQGRERTSAGISQPTTITQLAGKTNCRRGSFRAEAYPCGAVYYLGGWAEASEHEK